MGLFCVLALISTVLKVADLIAWSWWWLPLIFFGDVILVLVGLGFFGSTYIILKKIWRK